MNPEKVAVGLFYCKDGRTYFAGKRNHPCVETDLSLDPVYCSARRMFFIFNVRQRRYVKIMLSLACVFSWGRVSLVLCPLGGYTLPTGYPNHHGYPSPSRTKKANGMHATGMLSRSVLFS